MGRVRGLFGWAMLGAGLASSASAQVMSETGQAAGSPTTSQPATTEIRPMIGPGMPADYVPPQAGQVMTKVTGDITTAAAAVTRVQTAGGSAGCMVKTVTEEGRTALNVELIVPASEIETLLKAGFSEGPCKGRQQKLAANRDMLCQMASYGNEAVHLRLASLLALPPQRLCNAAKQLAPTIAAVPTPVQPVGN